MEELYLIIHGRATENAVTPSQSAEGVSHESLYDEICAKDLGFAQNPF